MECGVIVEEPDQIRDLNLGVYICQDWIFILSVRDIMGVRVLASAWKRRWVERRRNKSSFRGFSSVFLDEFLRVS